MVLKDYSHSSRGFRTFIAPFLVYREIRALRTLDDVYGVPKFVRKLSSHAFLIEFVPARRIRFAEDRVDWSEFIAGVERLIGVLHKKGVMHGDLRNATNILVDEQQHPVFVDFVSAVHRGHPLNIFSLILFKLCLPIDHGALFKLKEKYAPELIAPEEHHFNAKRGPLEIAVRWVSVRIRDLVQKIFP